MKLIKTPTAHLVPPRFQDITNRLIFGDNYKAMELPEKKITEFDALENDYRIGLDEDLEDSETDNEYLKIDY